MEFGQRMKHCLYSAVAAGAMFLTGIANAATLVCRPGARE